MTVPAESRRGKKKKKNPLVLELQTAVKSLKCELGNGVWFLEREKKNPLASQANYRSKTALLFFIISDDFTVSIKVLKSWWLIPLLISWEQLLSTLITKSDYFLIIKNRMIHRVFILIKKMKHWISWIILFLACKGINYFP